MSKLMKYRAVCPTCGKGFDTREGYVGAKGQLVCADCHKKIPYGTIANGDYLKETKTN